MVNDFDFTTFCRTQLKSLCGNVGPHGRSPDHSWNGLTEMASLKVFLSQMKFLLCCVFVGCFWFLFFRWPFGNFQPTQFDQNHSNEWRQSDWTCTGSAKTHENRFEENNQSSVKLLGFALPTRGCTIIRNGRRQPIDVSHSFPGSLLDDYLFRTLLHILEALYALHIRLN